MVKNSISARRSFRCPQCTTGLDSFHREWYCSRGACDINTRSNPMSLWTILDVGVRSTGQMCGFLIGWNHSCSLFLTNFFALAAVSRDCFGRVYVSLDERDVFGAPELCPLCHLAFRRFVIAWLCCFGMGVALCVDLRSGMVHSKNSV